MNSEIKSKITNCKTSKQVLKILNDNHIKYNIDDEMTLQQMDNGTAKSKALDLKLVNEKNKNIL